MGHLYLPESFKGVKFEPQKNPPKTDPGAETRHFFKGLGTHMNGRFLWDQCKYKCRFKSPVHTVDG